MQINEHDCVLIKLCFLKIKKKLGLIWPIVHSSARIIILFFSLTPGRVILVYFSYVLGSDLDRVLQQGISHLILS